MNHSNTKNTLKTLFSTVMAGTLLFSSCSGDKENTAPEESTGKTKYALITTAGTFPNNTSYLQGLESLDAADHITNSNSREFPSAVSLKGVFDGAAFVSTFGRPTSLISFTFDDQGKAVEGKRLTVPDAATFASLYIVDEHDAYGTVASSGNPGKIIRIDPTTMQKKGEVDVSLVNKPEFPSNFLQQIVKRGDKLFVGVHYGNHVDVAHGEAVIAIVDIATQKVEKLIQDNRTSQLLAGSNGGTMTLMPNGDIYVMGWGTTGKNPSGILRIKHNEERFDPDYFMNLSEKTGAVICRNFFPYSETKAITAGVVDPTDPAEFKGPNYNYYIIDLEDKIHQPKKVAGLPDVFYAASPAFLEQIDGEWLLNVAGDGTSTVYSFDPITETVAKKFTVDGELSTLLKLK